MSHRLARPEREHPVALAALEVRAALAGRLSAVSRPLAGQVHPAVAGWRLTSDGRAAAVERSVEERRRYASTYPYTTVACPFGAAGEVLWAQEPWAPCADRIEYLVGSAEDGPEEPDARAWRPAPQMPRAASRLSWRLGTIALHRLASGMTERLARAHGHPSLEAFAVHWNRHRRGGQHAPIAALAWDADPWVWTATLLPR